MLKERDLAVEEKEGAKRSLDELRTDFNEKSIKLDNYVREHERLFEENRRLKEHLNMLREEKEEAVIETRKLKMQA